MGDFSISQNNWLEQFVNAFDALSGWPEEYQNRDSLKYYKPHHAEEERFLYNNEYRYSLCKGGEGSGKGNPLDTIVPTPDGYTTIGEIDVGDLVFDEYGQSQSVIATSEIFHKDCYEIEFDTGEKIIADKDHLWTVYPFFSESSRTIDTELMYIEMLQEKEPIYTIPLSKPLNLSQKTYSVDPYEYGLQTKIIPAEYFRGSYTQRVELLTGLMDSGGYIDEKGICVFYSENTDLSKQVMELCFTLGIKAYKRYADHNSKLEIAFHPDIVVFRKERSDRPFKNEISDVVVKPFRVIVHIEKIDSVPTRCIKVDNPTGLFLITKTCIVTHNSVVAIIKVLEALKSGLSGAMLSPDLPHFKRSLWPEFRRWCPWDFVVDRFKYMANDEWFPFESSFQIVFTNGATLYTGGIDTPLAWEGPNLSFAMLDEARRKKDAQALKVLDGRIRIPGQNNEIPMLWFSTTPRKHWLYEYFGPIQVLCNECEHDYEIDIFEEFHHQRDMWGEWGKILPCSNCGSTDVRSIDDFEIFKKDAMVISLNSKDNEINMQEGYSEKRAQTLTEKEANIVLRAMWEDEENESPFLDDPIYWEACIAHDIPALTKKTPLYVAMDAGVSNDHFSIVSVSPWPGRNGDYIVRTCKTWIAKKNQKINFQGTKENPGPELYLRWLCKNYNVIMIGYDPYQLHDMSTRLGQEGEKIAVFVEFTQGTKRLEADKNLFNSIMEKFLYHNGKLKVLTEHVLNAGAKKDNDKLRLVKVLPSKKIDSAVSLSMALYLASGGIKPKKQRTMKKVKFLKV